MAPRRVVVKTGSRKDNSPYCCVYGCHNSYRNTAGKLPPIKFYRFPWKSYETERRQRWIAAVRRASSEGELWQPKRNETRICSAHFVGNERSNIAQHPAYIPTIFPPCYKKSDAALPQTKLGRFERIQRRSALRPVIAPTCQTAVSLNSEDDTAALEERNEMSDLEATVCFSPDSAQGTSASEECNKFASVMTQTENSSFQGPCSLFLSVVSQCDASTQVSHIETRDSSVQAEPAVRSTATGPEERSCVFLGYSSLCERKDAFTELCGVSANVFAMLMSLFSSVVVRSVDVPIPQKMVIFLMKMKLGISFASIAVLFGLHRTTVSRIFFFVLRNLLYSMQHFIPEPPQAAVKATMPACFKVHYPNCRFIIDCTEVRTEEPPTVEQRRALFSHYKGCYTLKFLIGILPNGAVTFVSKAYGGRASDTHITLESGFLNRIEPGDVVLADKGFPGIKAPAEGNKGIVVLPPFSKGNMQFTYDELQQTYHIAQVRIHVERAIQRIKLFNILNFRVSNDLIPYMSDIMRMCCILVNLQPPIINTQKLEQS
ncbi:uncharacterized protein [Dermacentor albipictus]|uniref:uncharacterized protein n=1 Tax=Dermacentor albipictus TaxID=60249 RepID=UPI0031FD4D43